LSCIQHTTEDWLATAGAQGITCHVTGGGGKMFLKGGYIGTWTGDKESGEADVASL
jgi:hypothetical protein